MIAALRFGSACLMFSGAGERQARQAGVVYRYGAIIYRKGAWHGGIEQ
jgi:hypothetical protein